MRVVTRRQSSKQLSREERLLLDRRAARLKEVDTTAEEEEAVYWLAEFPVGDEVYALPLERVRAAVPLRMVTPVPLAPSHVIGVLRFQGQLIPAFSLVSLLGVRGWRVDPEVLIVVESEPGRLTALDCEQIPKASGLPVVLLEEARARAAGPLVEITTRAMRQVILIDGLASLFADQREVGDAG